MIAILSIWHLSADVWTAIATWTAALVAVAAAIVAATYGRSQIRESRRLRQAEYQPYVVVFAADSEQGHQNVELVIKNTGRTAARGVRVVFSRPVDSLVLSPDHSPITVPDHIPVLVPGQEWRTFWDSALKRVDEEDRSARYTATVTYRDAEDDRELGPYEFVIDWSLIMNRGYITVHEPPDEQTKLLGRIAAALEGRE